MSKLIKFFEYLRVTGGETTHIDVTEKLIKLGYKTEDDIYDFLNQLSAKSM